MRIAQVAPLIESVPPKHYGGTERIVSYLTEELVRAGHDVTLFASGDSVTNARLIASASVRSGRMSAAKILWQGKFFWWIMSCSAPMSSILFIFIPVVCISRFRRTCQFPTSPLCMAALICLTCFAVLSGFEMCQLSQSRMLNGNLYHAQIGRRPFTMDYRRIFSVSPESGRLSGFLGTSLARKKSRSGDRNRKACVDAA